MNTLGTQFAAPAEVEYEHVEYALDPADPTYDPVSGHKKESDEKQGTQQPDHLREPRYRQRRW